MFSFARKFFMMTLGAAAISATVLAGPSATPSDGWFALRDNEGTSGGPKKVHDLQVAAESVLTSRVSLAAESTDFFLRCLSSVLWLCHPCEEQDLDAPSLDDFALGRLWKTGIS